MEDFMFGYIDPVAGATIMQLVVAGTVGIGAVVKLKWHTIRGFFEKSDATHHQPSDTVADVDEFTKQEVEPDS
jgi:hypothetical protein